MPTPQNDWMVSVPLSQLVEMQQSMQQFDNMREENAKLQRRIDGLHRTVFDLMEVVGSLRREKGVSMSAR